jgi:hypothetical protein
VWTKLACGGAPYASGGWAFETMTLKATRPDKVPSRPDLKGKKKKKDTRAKIERPEDYFNRRFTEMMGLQVTILSTREDVSPSFFSLLSLSLICRRRPFRLRA